MHVNAKITYVIINGNKKVKVTFLVLVLFILDTSNHGLVIKKKLYGVEEMKC